MDWVHHGLPKSHSLGRGARPVRPPPQQHLASVALGCRPLRGGLHLQNWVGVIASSADGDRTETATSAREAASTASTTSSAAGLPQSWAVTVPLSAVVCSTAFRHAPPASQLNCDSNSCTMQR